MLKKIFPIILLSFVNVIGFTLLIPLLPDIVAQYAPPEMTGFLYGALLSSYALFQFLAAPLLGALSDKYGRRPLLFLSQLGTMLSWVVFGAAYFVPEITVGAIALPLYVIAFSRVVDGITGGNVSVANAWIADITHREEKVQAFGILGATFGLGFLIGPALGGITGSVGLGYLGTSLVAFLISLITLLIIRFYLPESLPPSKRDHEVELHWEQVNILKKFTALASNQFVFSLLILRLFFSLVFASYTTIIILFMRNELGLSPAGLGIALSLIGVFSIVNQAILVKRVSAKIGSLQTLYLGVLLILGGLLVLPVLPTSSDQMIPLIGNWSVTLGLVVVLLNAYFMNLGISLSMPNFKSLLSSHTSDTKQGVVIGLDESLMALGNAITPIIAGSLYALIGPRTFWAFAILLTLPHLYIYLKTGSLKLNEPDETHTHTPAH